ncbi:MAG: hypothetical protein ACJAT1_001823 [Marivirga sp.]|jgi:hypothetical protein
MKKFFILLITGFMVAILLNVIFTENINSIDGGFEELAFTRNENNTGPVHRLYAFSVQDTLWENIQQHADLLAHTKYGTTEVYYFVNSDQAIPIALNLENSQNSNFDKAACIGYIKKGGMGNLSLKRYPFKD